MPEKKHIIIAGGGTGGHVYPAIAIADAIKEREPEAEIIFIGAEDRLEMKAVPKAGYKIIGLPVKGLKRQFSLENIKTIYLLFKSINKTRKIFKEFKPCAVVGVGGYASAPALRMAVKKRVPIILQEQNSFPGITNKIFAKHATKICAAYEQVYKYFPKNKVVITGNPVRKEVLNAQISKPEALKKFSLDTGKKTLLITGGSLGARTLNNAVLKNLENLHQAGIQVIWQTGKFYYDKILKQVKPNDWLKILPFIDDMISAYTAADLVIARAGAITISELSILGKPTIFVPSPNVAEDHQTKNALALVGKRAALMIKDAEAEEKLISLAIKTISNPDLLSELSKNIKSFAKPEANKEISKIVLGSCKD